MKWQLTYPEGAFDEKPLYVIAGQTVDVRAANTPGFVQFLSNQAGIQKKLPEGWTLEKVEKAKADKPVYSPKAENKTDGGGHKKAAKPSDSQGDKVN